LATELRLMLVDDHYLVRVGLSSVIALEPDMRVCAEAATGHQAIEHFRSDQPDVTLMDLRLPDLSGTEAIRTIRAEFPQARIIALSTFAGDEEIHMALEAGALAYLVKTVQPEELVDTIRKAAAGQRHVPLRLPDGNRAPRASNHHLRAGTPLPPNHAAYRCPPPAPSAGRPP